MRLNRSILALSAGLLASLAPESHAVSLNPNGGGQALIIPYYTTHGGNDTLLSLANTSDQGRAVKVRVHEYRLGHVVQDLNLYLGPNDVWTAALFEASAFNVSGAALLINDNSCLVLSDSDNQLMSTLPDGRRLLALRDPGDTGIPGDTGPQGADRARHGAIEIIEMAVVEPDTPTADRLRPAGGAPADCAAITAAWTAPGGEWLVNPSLDLTEPTGHGALTALAMIVEPARGSMFPVPVDALVGFNHQVLHTAPGDVEPTLASVNDADDTDLATARVVMSDGTVLTATYADDLDSGYGKIDAISALYAASSVSNDYFLTASDSVRAHSEWVMHYPTRRFYVDTLIEANTGNQFVSAPRAPFPGDAGSTGSCPEQVNMAAFDRAGRLNPDSGPIFTLPRPVVSISHPFCWQTMSLGFGAPDDPTAPSPILGSPAPFTSYALANMATEGRFRFTFVSNPASDSAILREPLEGAWFAGIPVTGFFVTVLDNAHVEGGTLANYAASFRHRIEQAVVAD